LVGTRAYAAPELLSTAAPVADARTDLYSLGCVLARCLGHWQSNLDASGLRRAITQETLLKGGVSEALARIVGRLSATNPDDRYASAADLLDDMNGVDGDATASRPRLHGPIVGRNKELERMRRTWAEAQRAGRVLLLTGDPGAGKSRLTRAFVDDMRASGVNALEAACHPRDPRSFSVVRQLVDGYLRQCDRLPAAERARALARVRRLAGDLGSVLKLLSPTVARIFHDSPTVPASENAEQAFAEGLPTFLGKLFREAAPVIIVIDDAQWIDASSRRVLSRTVQGLAARTLLLLDARSGDEAPAVERLVDGLSTSVIRIELAPLSDDDSIELVRDYLGTRLLDAEVTRTILGLSDGTPLRVLEVVRTLVDEGVLLPHWGEWKLDAEAVAQMHLPSHTTSLLRRRIAGLDAETRATLTTAAAIGMTFENELLVSVVGGESTGPASALAEARRSQLVEPAGARAHRFIHHTVRDALLGDESQLRAIHQRIAETLDASAKSSLKFEIEAETPDASKLVLGSPGLSSSGWQDADPLYRVAFHFAAGVPGQNPARLAETNILAG
ncbi:MAG TPA: AAA family ATPase, partial [Polyangiaceae bacterium]